MREAPFYGLSLFTHDNKWGCFDIFMGLAYIHAVPGVCHCNLKPQNLLVDPLTHQVKLCDFGSAKVLGQQGCKISFCWLRYNRKGLAMIIYLRGEILERCKFTGCEEIFLCDQIGVEASKGMHPGFSPIYIRPSQINLRSPLKNQEKREQVLLVQVSMDISSTFSAPLEKQVCNHQWGKEYRSMNLNMLIAKLLRSKAKSKAKKTDYIL